MKKYMSVKESIISILKETIQLIPYLLMLLLIFLLFLSAFPKA